LKLCTYGANHLGLILDNTRLLPIKTLNAHRKTDFPDDMLTLIASGRIEELKRTNPIELTWTTRPAAGVKLRLPYPAPPKIWCIGLNYLSHAEDIQAQQPEEPGSFMKPSSALVEPGGQIELPPEDLSNEVDAEGELGVIIGRRCRDVTAEQAREVIFGYTTTLDMTALDVLRRNPRYLTRAKSFDTFFSFGPVVVTADEIPDVDALEVITEHNGAVHSRDFVRNMRHRPFDLVSFHSRVFTWQPGDVLSTGCPKGARISPGDHVAARIEGVGRLEATVGRRPSAGPSSRPR
jgi:2-keto-4-pentenoate hydratase/2-oxohepta-3-ene-1,7-dioic acid hydratase in catechol pathway